jgi:carbamoylphosphate synthase large subunit
VDQPEWKELTTRKDAYDFADAVGFPVLVRPSFVLSGAAMSVASNEVQQQQCLLNELKKTDSFLERTQAHSIYG